ncbi:MAG: glycosyl hydrolase family 5 [Sediminibacterium sp.]|nr:glycosyl hydrolase family 5 [Sediminibacterium sp.]
MKKISLLAVVTLVACTHLYSQGFLKRKGTLIVDGHGEKFLLRGMGLGGWMLQEGYMFRLGNLGQQYRIRAKIEELVGKEKTDLFYDTWLVSHTTKTDIDSLAAWGFNSVRLPMHYALYTLPVEKEPIAGQDTWLEKGFALTDSLLAWCRLNRMYLILDLHATPGGQGNDLAISDRDAAKPSLWESQPNRDKMTALWKKLAARYANEPWIGGYDIINEPNWGFQDPKDTRGTSEQKNEPLRELMMTITKAIREVDTNHIVIIEGNGFGNNYNGILPAWDSNTVMSFHKYGNFNNTGAISRFLSLREKYGIPLWLGESGENSNTWFTEAIGLVESNNIGWAWWQGKKMGINNPLEIKMPHDYQKLLDYFSGKGPKPGADEAWAILQEFLANIRIENNVYHKDVTDAMFRQVHSAASIPFKRHRITEQASTIQAVDFDMGRQQVAYFDRDSASYQYTPGVNTAGNRGRAYRNDGVDIRAGKNSGYYIFNMEDGEWLDYSVDVERTGTYSVAFKIAPGTQAGTISLYSNGSVLVKEAPVPASAETENWQLIKMENIQLRKGPMKLRVLIDKGGFELESIQFMKQGR